MKGILLILSLFLFSFTEFQGKIDYNIDCTLKQTYVFVCDSNTSVAYHSSKTCRGLIKCTHNIIKVSMLDAKKKYHKRACHLCY